MRLDAARSALALLLGVGILSCKETPTSTRSPQGNVAAVSAGLSAAAGHLPSQSVTPFLATLGAALRQMQRDNNTTAIGNTMP